MAFKSVRLLTEAINTEMEILRKSIMAGDDKVVTFESLSDLRPLIDELVDKASRPSIDDVKAMSPGDYVATMKPLVRTYHQALMNADMLCQVLNEDLGANASIVMLIGDRSTVVRAAHDPNKPEAEIAVEAILTALDNNTKQVVADGVAEAERQLGIEAPPPEASSEPEPPLRVRYADPIQEQDAERNQIAEMVIDCNGVVIKDGYVVVNRPATQEEINSCIVVKDPATGVGYEDEL